LNINGLKHLHLSYKKSNDDKLVDFAIKVLTLALFRKMQVLNNGFCLKNYLSQGYIFTVGIIYSYRSYQLKNIFVEDYATSSKWGNIETSYFP